ncbi:hypothetical protein FE257_012548 [Aspergillus nanangensis]|uniref:Aldose 1-epimerase n=1 Tax=Aspergillus nanangensis TaxID=2582783 RepID=A0AAD4CVC8_ASPNN|nr:hypothetical protein FE257_012548 [Aspergillus nanangensis]
MHFTRYLPAALLSLPALALDSAPTDDPFKVYTISAKGITAKLIPYGARLTSLLVPDRDGKVQDVVVGYDDPKQYVKDTETVHSYFGPVVGRYANRIANGTFTIDGHEYHIPKNEKGVSTLHGGKVGYDIRNWTVKAHTKSSITFMLEDHKWEGFPGDVDSYATFSVDAETTPENPNGLPQLTSSLVAHALTDPTPIMLSNHIYWNLNGFKKENVLEDTFLQLPLSKRFIGTNSALIPNGTILEVADAYNGSPDFTIGKLVGQDIKDTEGLCGADCSGYDNCFIVDRPPQYAAVNSVVPVLRMNSSTTGISLEVATDQQAVQIYSCNGQNGSIPIKPSQAKRNKEEGIKGAKGVNQHGCIVIETEGWIDAINNPEWAQDQIFTPGHPAINYATYQFGTV